LYDLILLWHIKILTIAPRLRLHSSNIIIGKSILNYLLRFLELSWASKILVVAFIPYFILRISVELINFWFFILLWVILWNKLPFMRMAWVSNDIIGVWISIKLLMFINLAILRLYQIISSSVKGMSMCVFGLIFRISIVKYMLKSLLGIFTAISISDIIIIIKGLGHLSSTPHLARFWIVGLVESRTRA